MIPIYLIHNNGKQLPLWWGVVAGIVIGSLFMLLDYLVK